MEFAWTESQQRYREQVATFLEDNLPDDWFDTYCHGLGSPQQIDYARIFCPKLAKAGLLTPQWPAEYGGRDGEPWEQFILAEELWSWGEPRGPQYMNVNWIGPALMRFGTAEQKAEHLSRIATGEVIWCQGFSEPQAGTDLAALQTKAERIGDHYLINGMKIWTSYSYKADWCFLLARTGPERKAISCFLVPMNSKGVSVVPFPGLPEYGHLNEVFFEDVEVPLGNLVGEEGKGWEVITYALSYERVGLPRYHWGRKVLDTAVAQLQAEGRFDDPMVRAHAGRIVSKFEAARVLTYLVVDQRVKRTPDTTDPNVQRITAADACCELMNFLMEYLPDCLSGGERYLELFYRHNIPATIAAGTYELQLDLIAQRGLTLPRGR
ncbi:MAG: acyl-CoA dehydrogenase [Caulobacter sp.]|nr:acyl-CoA dehydrogenase [Caulobacter sp.]